MIDGKIFPDGMVQKQDFRYGRFDFRVMTEPDPTGPHTMAMDWSPSAINVYRDGARVWTITDREVIPDVAHHLTIRLDAVTTRTLTRRVSMYVDYVRIYRYMHSPT